MDKNDDDKCMSRIKAMCYVILGFTVYFVTGVILGWVLSLAEVKLLILGLKPL